MRTMTVTAEAIEVFVLILRELLFSSVVICHVYLKEQYCCCHKHKSLL